MAHALHCLGLALAGWGNRHHEDRIDYLRDRLAQEEIDEAGDRAASQGAVANLSIHDDIIVTSL